MKIAKSTTVLVVLLHSCFFSLIIAQSKVALHQIAEFELSDKSEYKLDTNSDQIIAYSESKLFKALDIDSEFKLLENVTPNHYENLTIYDDCVYGQTKNKIVKTCTDKQISPKHQTASSGDVIRKMLIASDKSIYSLNTSLRSTSITKISNNGKVQNKSSFSDNNLNCENSSFGTNLNRSSTGEVYLSGQEIVSSEEGENRVFYIQKLDRDLATMWKSKVELSDTEIIQDIVTGKEDNLFIYIKGSHKTSCFNENCRVVSFDKNSKLRFDLCIKSAMNDDTSFFIPFENGFAIVEKDDNSSPYFSFNEYDKNGIFIQQYELPIKHISDIIPYKDRILLSDYSQVFLLDIKKSNNNRQITEPYIILIPNPVESNLDITWGEESELYLINSLGLRLKTISLNRGKVTLDMSYLPEGIYFLADKSRLNVEKIIKASTK